MQARTLWWTLWGLLAAAALLFTLGLIVYGNGFGQPLLYLAAFALLAALLVLRMWMWQKAYEGKTST